MSKLSEYIDFLNRDDLPSKHEWSFIYNCISRTEQLLKARENYRTAIRKQLTDQQQLTFDL